MLRSTFQPNRKINLLSKIGHLNFNESYNLFVIKLSDTPYHYWGYTTLKLTLRCTDNYRTEVYDYLTEYKLHMTDDARFSRISISYTDLTEYNQPYFVSPIFLLDGCPHIAIWKAFIGNASPIVDLTIEYLGSSEYQTFHHGLFMNMSAKFYNAPNILKYTRTQAKHDLYDIYNNKDNVSELKDIFKNLSLDILNDTSTSWISVFCGLELYAKNYAKFKIPKNKYDYIKIQDRRTRGGQPTSYTISSEWPMYNGGLNEFIDIIKKNQCFMLTQINFSYNNNVNYYQFQSTTGTNELGNAFNVLSESALVYMNEDDLYWYIRLSDLLGNEKSNNTPDNVIDIYVRDPVTNPFKSMSMDDLVFTEVLSVSEKKTSR